MDVEIGCEFCDEVVCQCRTLSDSYRDGLSIASAMTALVGDYYRPTLCGKIGRSVMEYQGFGTRRSQNPSPGSGWQCTPSFRLRRRGRLTRAVEESLTKAGLGVSDAGGKTSLTIVRLWLESLSVGGAKVTAGHLVELKSASPAGEGSKEKPSVCDWLLTIRIGGSSLDVSLGVYQALSAYACFRPRTSDLVMSLRSRAVQLGKELDYPTGYTSLCLAGSVALAMFVTKREEVAWSALGGRTGRRVGEMSSAYRDGEIPRSGLRDGVPVFGFWDHLRARLSSPITWEGGIFGLRGGLSLPRSKA